MHSLDVEAVRAQFPALSLTVHDHPLVYLDNAATTQKPDAVLQAIQRAYIESCANVHRGVHHLSQVATDRYEAARERVARFLGAYDPTEIVFTRGTTEALNLVAATIGHTHLDAGDEVLVTGMEHHSSLVPWQRRCEEVGATLRVLPLADDGSLRMDLLDERLGPRTRIVAVVHVSNSLGTVNPVAELARRAHAVGALVVVDGAQAVVHGPVDVRALGADAYAFSGHKVYGPQGIGALWMRRELLRDAPVWQVGGDMVLTVSLERSTWNAVPHRFEAGTPNVVGAIGLAAALDWLEDLGWDAIQAHEATLLAALHDALAEVPSLRLIGTAPGKQAVASFVLEGVHPHDIGTLLDLRGVAVRTGHHCTMPVMAHFGVPATARASLGVYNTLDDVERLAEALRGVREMFG